MYRSSGPIPPISAERYPKRLLVFDTESYRAQPINGVEFQSLRLGVAHYLSLADSLEIIEDDWLNFTSLDELLSYVLFQTRKDKSLYIYAHNIKYDLALSGLLTALIAEGFKSSLFVIEDPPTFIRLKRGRVSIIFVDTFNYWQYSLKEMGEQLGTAKLTMPEEDANISEWFAYCRRDVEVLSDYLITFIRFLRDNDLAPLGLTLASQAFRAYRHRFMNCEIVIHNRKEVLSLERDCYYGGRTDSFFIGMAEEQDYFKLDVNSMYPFVMRDNSYPIELIGYSENIPLERLADLMGQYYCIADIELDTLNPAYPYVNGAKLVFPTGVFRTCLHHCELERALERREIKTVYRVAIYKRGDIFKEYVNYFYELKLKAEREDNKILRKQAKIFLNSLYGKFGQRAVISRMLPNTGAPQYQRLTGWSDSLQRNIEVNYIGNTIEIRYKGGESCYSSPVIAGAVTAYARVYLWELIERAGVNNVFYCDTDSIITTRAGYINLTAAIDPQRIGALKLEGVETHLTIYSVKDYEYGLEVKVKGIPKNARKLSANQWEYEQFRGAKTWVSQGLPVGVEVYTRRKMRVSSYDKGIITPTGRVVPLLLSGGS